MMRLLNRAPFARRMGVLALIAASAAVAVLLQAPDARGAGRGANAGKIDCDKVHAYYCPVAVGGPRITGDAGAVAGGATVSASDADGTKATDAKANRDGSFSIGMISMGNDFSMPVGSKVTVCVGTDCCTVTVEKCPPIGVEIEPREMEMK